jgi:BirA family biotin operon repressor/biotin-[acetyl-CoA-carboxylase] ligase
MNMIRDPRFIHLSETDSTNKYLQRLSETEEIPSGSVALADYQTAGRGQTGSVWESDAGLNLTFSLLFRPANLPANRPFALSETASLSVKYTLDKYIPDISVKWPNDIYCKDRKITGILIENTILQGRISRSIIGIGLNVNQTKFSADMPNPVSMAQAAGTAFDGMAVLAVFRQIFAEQSKRLDSMSYDAIHNDYLNAAYRKSGFHKYSDGKEVFSAMIYDIEPDGHLILERTDGSRSRYAFKEVTFGTESVFP